MDDSQSDLDLNDDDWGDFDSNVEEDDYDASTLDNNIINSKIEQKSSTQYEIFSQNDIKLKINDIVENVSSYLELPQWTATLLLRYFKWNKEDILEKYWKHDTEELLRKCGVLTADLKQKPPKYANNKFECPMCLNEDINVLCNAFEIGCGHIICNNCWCDYIVTNIRKNGKQCINLQCPYFKCNVIIPPPFIIRHIPQNMQDLQYRYQRFSLENYIEVKLSILAPKINLSNTKQSNK